MRHKAKVPELCKIMLMPGGIQIRIPGTGPGPMAGGGEEHLAKCQPFWQQHAVSNEATPRCKHHEL